MTLGYSWKLMTHSEIKIFYIYKRNQLSDKVLHIVVVRSDSKYAWKITQTWSWWNNVSMADEGLGNGDNCRSFWTNSWVLLVIWDTIVQCRDTKILMCFVIFPETIINVAWNGIKHFKYFVTCLYREDAWHRRYQIVSHKILIICLNIYHQLPRDAYDIK